MKPTLSPSVLTQIPTQARSAYDSASASARELLSEAHARTAPARAQVAAAAEGARAQLEETRGRISSSAHKAGEDVHAVAYGVTAAGVLGLVKVLSLPIEALEVDALDDLDVDETDLP